MLAVLSRQGTPMLPTVQGLSELAVLTMACNRSPTATAPHTPVVSFTIVSGNTQSAPVNTRLASPLRVPVLTPSSQPVPHFVLSFVVRPGGGSVFGGAETTNAQGYADEQFVFKPGNGEYEHESLEWTLQAKPEAPPVILEPVAT
jgi:hypothetical protein